MKDLSLHILDIIQNSIRARAQVIEADLSLEKKGMLAMAIRDNGNGMNEDQLEHVKDPFFTTRNTRRIGMGVSLLSQKAEQAGGSLEIHSESGKGTLLKAVFDSGNPDCPPLGDIPECAWMLMAANPAIRFIFRLSCDGCSKSWDSLEIRETLDGVPLTEKSIRKYILDWFNKDFGTFKENIQRI